YLRMTLDGRISVASLAEPTPADLDGAVLIDALDAFERGEWTSNIGEAVRVLVWKDDPNADENGKQETTRELAQTDLTDFDSDLSPQAREIVVETLGTHSGSTWLARSGSTG